MKSDGQVEPETKLGLKIVPGSPEVARSVPEAEIPEIQVKNTIISFISDDQAKFDPKLAAIFTMKNSGNNSRGENVKKKRTKIKLKMIGKSQNKITHHFKIRQEGELNSAEAKHIENWRDRCTECGGALIKSMGGLCEKMVTDKLKLTASNEPNREEIGLFAQARRPDKCSNKVERLKPISRSKRKRKH